MNGFYTRLFATERGALEFRARALRARFACTAPAFDVAWGCWSVRTNFSS